MLGDIEYCINGINEAELDVALKLVYDVFMEFEAPDYSDEGVKTFCKFIELNSIKNSVNESTLSFWGCFFKQKIVGVIAMRQVNHICMLFVDRNFHRKGIGRSLFETALMEVKNNSSTNEITVNSSPYAVEFYHRIGFEDTNKEQVIDGIRFTPMKFLIV